MSTDANALEHRPSLGHIRGLDGIRAMSVLAIIAFHSGLNWLPGGYYGVDSFFVLSGFLITSLLVKEWGTSGTIRLRRFWAGRARRLLPALFVMVAVVGFVLAVWPEVLATPHVVGDALAAVFYASNWYSVSSSATYFTVSAQPSPLLHTWSLAIEEQFYLVWPLVVLAVLKCGTGRRRAAQSRSVPVIGGGELLLQDRAPAWTRRRRLHVLFVVACLGSLASALTMAILAPDGYTTRAYYGTDTRAQALLVGAAIAIGLTLWREGSRRPRFVRSAAVLGLAGMVGTGAIWATTAETSKFAFCGGFLVASLAAGAVVLGVAAAPRSLAVRLLELPPLPQWGRISYGIYLWYWPVLLIMSGSRLHWGVYELFVARVAVTVGIAALSYRFVEMPIRRGALRRWRSVVAAPIGAALAVGAVFAASTLVPVGASALNGAPPNPANRVNAKSVDAVEAAAAEVPSPAALLEPPILTKDPARRVKVLLVGDSMAGSLGVGLGRDAAAHGIEFVNEGIPGCSASTDGVPKVQILIYSLPPGGPCAQPGAGSLFATWQRWIDRFNPDVVVYLGRGETLNQQVDGQWQNLGQPAFDRYVAQRFRQAVSILGSRGATVVLLTSPYYSSGELPSGSPFPEDTPLRVRIDNETIRSVAASTPAAELSAAHGTVAHGKAAGGLAAGPAGAARPVAVPPVAGGHKVYVYDLNRLVTPGGHFQTSEHGVTLRCGDGVHFTPLGGMFVGVSLLPDLAALGQAHAASSPGGSWPGPLPPALPPWYEKLSCH